MGITYSWNIWRKLIWVDFSPGSIWSRIRGKIVSWDLLEEVKKLKYQTKKDMNLFSERVSKIEGKNRRKEEKG